MKRACYRFDRAAIRTVLETQGRDEALKRWPLEAVDPIARLLGLIPRYRPTNTWKAEWSPLLGTRPDHEIAAMLGIPTGTVSAYRRMLGVRKYTAAQRIAARQAVLSAISDEELAGPLDRLAAKYALSFMDLRTERKRRKVTARDKRGRKTHPDNLRRAAALALHRQFPDATLQSIGDVLGCSRERVRQYIYESEAVAS